MTAPPITNGKIVSLRYMMTNGRGEMLEDTRDKPATAYLHGSAAISMALQSQLTGMHAGERKNILLKKGTDGADDDFSFEVIILEVRDANPDELRLGHPLTPVKIHLLGGFLGSGKTTAITQACLLLSNKNIAAAVITNDQGVRLVDNQHFRSLGIPSRQVTGGCFCCNYGDLDESIRSLLIINRPAILFAESVGSCTDIVATVLKPLLSQHPGWLTTVTIIADALLLDRLLNKNDRSFADTVRYIYFKQLDEAQVILVSKADLLNKAQTRLLQQQMAQRYNNKTVLYHNSFEEADINRWLQALDDLPAQPSLPSLDIDYHQYAEGEARLAWLDQELEIHCPGLEAQEIAQTLMTHIHQKIREKGYPIGHLKFMVDGEKKISFTATDAEGFTPKPTHTTILLINARVQADPAHLMGLVADMIGEIQNRHACGIKTLGLKSLQPGYPRPTHRMV